MRDYELLLLIRPNLDRDSAIVASESIAELIKNRGGEIKSSNVWGRRRLAYPISDQLEATYILLKLKISPSALKDIDFELKLNESVLRFMIIKDELVDAAATEAITETEAEQPVEAEAETAEVSAEAQAAEEVVEEAAAEEETSEEAEAATEEAVAEADVEAAEEAEEPETEATEAS